MWTYSNIQYRVWYSSLMYLSIFLTICCIRFVSINLLKKVLAGKNSIVNARYSVALKFKNVINPQPFMTLFYLLNWLITTRAIMKLITLIGLIPILYVYNY